MALTSLGFQVDVMRERLALRLAPWVAPLLTVRPGPPCPQCGSPATRENAASRVAGAMLCDDCGCRWRP